MHPFSQGNFKSGFTTFFWILRVGLIFCKTAFQSVSCHYDECKHPVFPTREYCIPGSVTLLFWSPNKNSTTTFSKLKGNKAFSQAERLFPSDNFLSLLRCEQKTGTLTRLCETSAALPSAGCRLMSPGCISVQGNQ